MDETKYKEDPHKRTAALQNLLLLFRRDFFQFARRSAPISFPESSYPCPATLRFAIVFPLDKGNVDSGINIGSAQEKGL